MDSILHLPEDKKQNEEQPRICKYNKTQQHSSSSRSSSTGLHDPLVNGAMKNTAFISTSKTTAVSAVLRTVVRVLHLEKLTLQLDQLLAPTRLRQLQVLRSKRRLLDGARSGEVPLCVVQSPFVQHAPSKAAEGGRYDGVVRSEPVLSHHQRSPQKVFRLTRSAARGGTHGEAVEGVCDVRAATSCLVVVVLVLVLGEMSDGAGAGAAAGVVVVVGGSGTVPTLLNIASDRMEKNKHTTERTNEITNDRGWSVDIFVQFLFCFSLRRFNKRAII